MTTLIAGHEVHVDTDGFMTDPQEWTADIARHNGIDPLTPRHWKVIEFCRRDAVEKGTPPGVRRIVSETGIPMKEIYQLFPKGPGILASRISGLTKPKSCV